jgi:hypothetical protein
MNIFSVSPAKVVIPSLVISLAMLSQAGAELAVDWGGDYVSANTNTSFGGSTLSTGDYDFGSGSSDRARILAIGTNFTPSGTWSTPPGKTSTIKTGGQVANLNSSTDPTFANYRISATDSLQISSSTTGGTPNMRLSGQFFATKDNFLNGLSSTPNLSFANATDGAALTAGWTSGSTLGVREAYFLVQNGSSWYVTFANSATTLAVASINPYSSTWYALNAATNQFLDVDNLGTGVLGSTFADIQAFGVYAQNTLYDGSTAGPVFSTNAFSVSLLAAPVPEANGFVLGGLGLFALVVCKRHRGVRFC